MSASARGHDAPLDLVLHGATKIDADGVVRAFWLAAAAGAVVATGTGGGWRDLVAARAHPSTVVHDARAGALTPGFIDLHGHGGGGHAFDDDASDAIAGALAVHRAHGTTRSVISLVADPLDALENRLDRIADLTGRDPLVLGAHLEGPFLAEARKGAHNADFLIDPTPDAVGRLLDAARGTLAQITIAPERRGALDAIERFAAAGVVPAVGHTDADAALAGRAFDRGARLLTHAFNAMPGIHHRAPGPVVAALGDDRVVLELILDGEHVHPSVARLAFDAAPGRVALITDAMAAAGAADGDYALGSLDVTVAAGVARVAGTDTIAGSTLLQDTALGLAIESCGLEPVAAVSALTDVPARTLGRDGDLGLLRAGFRADAVLLDDDWRAVAVWAEGVRVV